ncbi:jumonji, AT rich interactive domain 2 [Megachile rotundata]|uniref:jumonji, AT rich interactive domain 2 n=1 Tax=Megachile rotundata TaxID=143995 RepID=UPI000258E4D7|nr:PREDICTED: calponin homology domain-containing protein DDB_G0272472 [Megachile rotundata]XP_012143879.1 PREDICTED: calponin homology domain-containing protein DDB_G0272472 [Megachile rotundata]
MVLSRNDKRKRKEGDLVDLMEPLSESPKRTKVHAQRKFAQGATNVFNPTHTPIKDKEKAKPAVITELITHKRPNTEDFLTFLCFRGTSILPPSLNFFNVGNKKEKSEPKPLRTSVDKNVCSSTTSNENQKLDTSQKTVTRVKPAVNDKKKVSSTIQKNISTFKSATSTVQALKKKYQEQRLAKERIKHKFKASCVMRTRSCTERTMLKSTNQLAPRKFLPRIETKRLGLRSSVLADKMKKTSPKVKSVPPKPKKKVTIKQNNSDTSNSDSTSEYEEEGPSEKSVSQMKRAVQKNVQKNMCTRSKSETRRITRSHTGTISPKNLNKRPTRKTKEAAAVYMEILGRKLVSPDLENDDNGSMDSFPELPNARKSAQTENEAKVKVKQPASKPVTKTKDGKVTAIHSVAKKRLDKTTVSKIAFKSKRLIRVQKYCEIDSDEDSVSSSNDTSNNNSNNNNNTRPVTRRSLGKLNKPASRFLRSSTKNVVTRIEVQNNVNIKPKPQVQTNVRFNKDKFVIKRKREQNFTKSLPEKGSEIKQKESKVQSNADGTADSDEETLGTVLNKIKRKKDDHPQTEEISSNNNNNNNCDVTDKVEQSLDENSIKVDLSKVSDDEESFRGFTKKTISKVLNSCQTHVNANLLVAEKTEDTPKPTKIEDEKNSDPPNKEENTELISNESFLHKTSVVANVANNQCTQSERMQKTKLKSSNEIEFIKHIEKECHHKPEMSSGNDVDISLSTLHVRKEKVNMSTEQIEKWLNESSFAKEESKLEMENVSTFKYDICEKKADVSHLSISTKIQHLVRPVNVTLSKLAEKANAKDRMSIQSKFISTTIIDTKSSEIKQENEPTIVNKSNVDLKDVSKARNAKLCKDLCAGEESDVTLKSDQTVTDGTGEKKLSSEKKTIFQPRKPFLPKVKERKTVIPNANAFSPENESSVYAFESDTEIPVNTPFRRKIRESTKSNASTLLSENTEQKSEIDTNKSENNTNKTVEKMIMDNSEILESKETSNNISSQKECETVETKNTSNTTLNINKFELPKNFATLANIQVLPLDKLTTTWSNVNCSASIAVQVNLDDNAQTQEQTGEGDSNQHKSTEISTQTESNNENDDENDGQLFYIPLQAVTRNGPNLVQGQQLIQGVAVKLGTEGPNGPNQKVLLRAKLVTKPPSSIARCPPVGTVQPTTRTPPNSTFVTTDHSTPSTSSTVTSVIPASTSEIQSTSPCKNENIIQTVSKQNTGILSSTGTEKLTKSPKTSRERKTSIDSNKNGKRCQIKSKQKNAEVYSPSNNVTFPSAKDLNSEACLVEAPTFHPSEKDFQDPLEYIDKIRPVAEKFGICRVVPPPNFKPECKVSDDMRFTAYNQYVHRMLHRWGPNVKEMMAIKKYLATQSITLTHPPWIGGMEVDLPHLYQTVQSLGGLKEVIEKKKWQKVADGMKIPKSAQDRVTKLDDIYCKYLLPYDTLSPEERSKLFDEVESEWIKRESKALQRQNAPSTGGDNDEDEEDDSSDEIEECIVKGRNMPLNAFYRIARNTQRMWFGENQRSGNEAEGASADEVESAFWKHVAERKRHVCVHAASIDSSGRGFGFSVAKNSPFARHPWNLKVLTNNAGSVLRALGPIMGVTVPTLHVGMLFSACCWYRDPHGLPWIEYLHTGAKKIWYGIPDEHNNNFREALSKMVPRYCKNKTIWLPSDTAMVPPELLVSNGVSLCHTVQEPGQFIIVFPKAFTSSICTGYVVSESVYFAQLSWLETAEQVFKDIQDSCEPSIFSFERLLFNIINDSRSHIEVLKQILPSVIKIREKEISSRKQLVSVGLLNTERLPLPDSGKRKKGKKVKEDDGDFECEVCRANLFVSLVSNSQDDSIYCLPHALQLFNKKKQTLKHCTLMYTYNEDELDELIHKLEERIEAKSKKTNQIKQTK